MFFFNDCHRWVRELFYSFILLIVLRIILILILILNTLPLELLLLDHLIPMISLRSILVNDSLMFLFNSLQEQQLLCLANILILHNILNSLMQLPHHSALINHFCIIYNTLLNCIYSLALFFNYREALRHTRVILLNWVLSLTENFFMLFAT